jgi:hypothetical protein
MQLLRHFSVALIYRGLDHGTQVNATYLDRIISFSFLPSRVAFFLCPLA